MQVRDACKTGTIAGLPNDAFLAYNSDIDQIDQWFDHGTMANPRSDAPKHTYDAPLFAPGSKSCVATWGCANGTDNTPAKKGKSWHVVDWAIY